MLSERSVDLLYRILGDRIRKQRIALSYNQSEFASDVGISRSSLVNIEKGRQRAPLHVLYTISELLNLEIQSLLPSLEDFDIETELTEMDVLEKIDYQLEQDSLAKVLQFANKKIQSK